MITGTGMPSNIIDIERRRQLECLPTCGSKHFSIIVVPKGVVAGATIVNVKCQQCDTVFVVSDNGEVGSRESKYKDHQGRNHHVMKAETGYFKR